MACSLQASVPCTSKSLGQHPGEQQQKGHTLPYLGPILQKWLFPHLISRVWVHYPEQDWLRFSRSPLSLSQLPLISWMHEVVQTLAPNQGSGKKKRKESKVNTAHLLGWEMFTTECTHSGFNQRHSSIKNDTNTGFISGLWSNTFVEGSRLHSSSAGPGGSRVGSLAQKLGKQTVIQRSSRCRPPVHPGVRKAKGGVVVTCCPTPTGKPADQGQPH